MSIFHTYNKVLMIYGFLAFLSLEQRSTEFEYNESPQYVLRGA